MGILCSSASLSQLNYELINSQNMLKKQFEFEIEKLKNESTKLQEQLEQKTAEINQYKASEKEKIVEDQKQKVENMKLNDISTELERKILKLNELITQYKETEDLEIETLKNDIGKLKMEKHEMEEAEQKIRKLTSENFSLKNELSQIKNKEPQTNISNNSNHDVYEKLSEHVIQIQPIQPNYNPQPNPSEIDENYTPLLDLRSDEENLTDNRVRDTLRRASDVVDVTAFVVDQYMTPVFDAQDMDDYDYESSLSSFERMEVEQAKLERDKQEEMDEDVAEMSHELENMRNEEAHAIQKEISAMHMKIKLTANVDLGPDSEDSKLSPLSESDRRYSDKELSVLVLDADMSTPSQASLTSDTLDRRKSNLFRTNSGCNWKTDDLIQQKKEMAAALAYLVKEHIHSNNADIE